MAWVGFESERLKNRQSGLGKFCEFLGLSLLEENRFDLQFFQKKKTKRLFPKPAQYGKLYNHNKFMGVSTGVDLWHCTQQLSSYLPSDHTIPVVTTIHDLNFIYESSHEFKVRRKLAKVQQTIDRSTALVFISHFTAEEVHKHLKVGRRITEVIYNGPALQDMDPDPVPNERRRPYFFSIGLITEKKNFHTLIPLLLEFPEHEIIIAGNRSDAYAMKLVKKAEKLGVDDRLILTGEITETEKAKYYRDCEAFLMPSVAEGFGLPVVEAMHFGKPVFLSTFGSLPEIGGNEAYYWSGFEPDDMARVLRAGLADFRADAARREAVLLRAQGFSWKKAARAYGDLYEKVLGR